jgi:DNA polymerase
VARSGAGVAVSRARPISRPMSPPAARSTPTIRAFERLIWWRIMSERHGWPKPRLEQFRCTAVTAAAMSLPRSLDRLGAALDLAIKKDGKGRKLIKAHSLPQGWADGLPIWNEDPAGLAEFHDYCDTDVLTEEEAARRLSRSRPKSSASTP